MSDARRRTGGLGRALLALALASSALGCEGVRGRGEPSKPSEPFEARAEARPEPARAAPGAEAPASDPEAAQRARAALVARVAARRPWGEARWDPRVLTAMREVPRHLFAPGLSLEEAYEDRPQPIGHGQTISQPSIVAIMSTALELEGDERVLEIGTGSGYQAAVLARLTDEVYSIELVPALGEAARERLARLGYDVHVRIGDGYRGWPEKAPFDRVILTAAPPKLPKALFDQLAEGGILVAPVGDAYQELVRYRKRGGEIQREDLGPVQFVPMVPGGAGG